MIRSALAHVLLVGIYGSTWLVATLGKIIPHRAWQPTQRILVTGAFHNPNWYLSHVTPLSRSGVKEVILVVDEPQLPLDKVRFVCAPSWSRRLFGRIGARSLWMLMAALHYRPDLYMGYHIIPGACSALLVGRLLGRPTCYQMTAGPVEVAGGGFEALESAGGLLGRPSKFIETMALAVVNLFDLIVVRGRKAADFLTSHDITSPITIITGSVNDSTPHPEHDRDIHLIFVGRLSATKQVEQFIAVVHAVAQVIPGIRAAVVGDGPLKMDLRTQVEKLGLAENVKFFGQRNDVESLLAHSKVFVLTSKSEGLSIAMAEAMAAGVVPVVADIGELGDLVIDGVNGYLIEPNNISEYSRKALRLLSDEALWAQHSRKAMEVAKKNCGMGNISQRWRQHLREAISQASGHRTEEVVD